MSLVKPGVEAIHHLIPRAADILQVGEGVDCISRTLQDGSLACFGSIHFLNQ